MDFIVNFPFFTIILAMISAVVCSVLRGNASKQFTAISLGVSLALSLTTLLHCIQQNTSFTYMMGHFPAPWGNEIRFGMLECLLSSAFVLILLLSVVGNYHFMLLDIDQSKINLYYVLINLLSCALLAMVYTNDIFTGYVFLEILTLTSGGILMIREEGKTTIAATRYMILNLLGSALFLIGITICYNLTGHLLMEDMSSAILKLVENGNYPTALKISGGLMCIGLAIKSGLFPFHYWMPDTYGTATPMSSSVLSGLVSKGYIFLLIKILYRVFGLDNTVTQTIQTIVLILGMCGIIFGSLSAMKQTGINRMLALSSAAQIGYIYMGIGLGGTLGFTAAIFHILTHAITKPLLFLSASRLIEASDYCPKFHALNGAGHRDKVAGVAFTTGSLSMIGLPLFAGFSSKILFCFSALDSHSNVVTVIALIVLAVSTLLNALYFLRTVVRLYMPVNVSSSHTPQTTWAFIVASVCFIVMNIGLGLFFSTFQSIIARGLAFFG